MNSLSKNKRGAVVLPIIIGLLLLLGVGGGLYYFDVFEQTAVVGAGCDFIPNSDDPNSAFTEILTDVANFECDTDECIVSGSMDVSKGIEVDGEIHCEWTPAGSCCIQDGNVLRCRNADWSIGGIVTKYEASYNFCPEGNPNAPECTGEENVVTSEGIHVTDTYKLKSTQLDNNVFFSPTYFDNTPVIDHTIFVKKYDCSCGPAVESGDACDSGQLYCSPRVNSCPVGMRIYSDRNWCNTIDGGHVSGYYSDMCRISATNRECVRPVTDNSQYRKCDTTQELCGGQPCQPGQSGSTCGDWGTTENCPSNQLCYTNDGELSAGLGGCRCSDDPCILGGYTPGESGSDSAYNQCVDIGGCLGWSSERNCPAGLKYSQTSADNGEPCVCDGALSCEPIEDDICIDSSNIRRCEAISVSGKTCWQMSESEFCGDDRECSNNVCVLKSGCQYNNPSCDSEFDCVSNNCVPKTTGDYCIGTEPPECISNTQVNNCESIGGGVFRWTVSVCEGETQCVDGHCQSAGCAFGTAGRECSNTMDSNGIQVEQCVDNECIAVQDILTATVADFQLAEPKCYNNRIMNVVRYAAGSDTNFVNVYRWEEGVQCGGQTPICIGDQL